MNFPLYSASGQGNPCAAARSSRRRNLAGFQAARTGEVLVDDKLASLAQKDPSRFQRMSQRFHSQVWMTSEQSGDSCPALNA